MSERWSEKSPSQAIAETIFRPEFPSSTGSTTRRVALSLAMLLVIGAMIVSTETIESDWTTSRRPTFRRRSVGERKVNEDDVASHGSL